MLDFIDSITSYPFLQNAVLASLLASIICGIIGTFVVIKKISHISGSIAHTVLGGIGIAYFLGINPILGAYLFAILAAIIIALIKLKSNQHEDTIISALWAVGMAIGVIFMFLTPGYNIDLLNYLFGNILLVSSLDIRNLVILTILIFFFVLFFYRLFIAVCFDEEHSRLRGLPVDLVYVLLLVLIALTVVVLIRVIGLILVIALLALPAAIASLFVKTPFKIMLAACGLSIIFTLSGLVISYGPNLPSGPMIILISGSAYLLAISLRKIFS